jgi:8-oxo-dGTP diphosphatase
LTFPAQIPAVSIVTPNGTPRGSDDAKVARLFREDEIPTPIVFDHAQILRDYFQFKKTGRRPKP